MNKVLLFLFLLSFFSFGQEKTSTEQNKQDTTKARIIPQSVPRQDVKENYEKIIIDKQVFEQALKNADKTIDLLKWIIIISITLIGLFFTYIKIRDDRKQREAIQSLKEEYSKYQTDLKEANNNLTKAQSELTNKAKMIGDIINDITGLEKKIRDFENRIESKREKFEQKIDKKTDRSAQANRYYNMANEAFDKKNYKEAIELYTKVIEITPEVLTKIYAYSNRGSVYSRIKVYDNAINDYNKAIELKPDYAFAYQNRAYTYERIGKYHEALEDLKHTLKLEPQNSPLHLGVSELYIILNELGEAKKSIDSSLQLVTEKKYKAIALLLDIILKILKDEDTKEQKENLDELLKEDFEITWLFDDLEDWLGKIDIPQAKKKKIADLMKLLKAKKK